MESSDRRKFLGVCLGGVMAAAAGAIAYPLYSYLAPRKQETLPDKVVIPQSELPEGKARFFEYAGSAAVLVRKRGGAIIALSAVCTHLGCIVQWQEDKQNFLCPCHAGNFSADGAVVSGPPPKPLAKLPFIVTEGNITVG